MNDLSEPDLKVSFQLAAPVCLSKSPVVVVLWLQHRQVVHSVATPLNKEEGIWNKEGVYVLIGYFIGVLYIIILFIYNLEYALILIGCFIGVNMNRLFYLEYDDRHG